MMLMPMVGARRHPEQARSDVPAYQHKNVYNKDLESNHAHRHQGNFSRSLNSQREARARSSQASYSSSVQQNEIQIASDPFGFYKTETSEENQQGTTPYRQS